MYIPLVEKIGHSSAFSIDGRLPRGLENILEKMGMDHVLDGGHVFREGCDVEIKIERTGGFFDKILFGYSGPKKASIQIYAGDPAQSQPYEQAIQNFLDDNGIKYHAE